MAAKKAVKKAVKKIGKRAPPGVVAQPVPRAGQQRKRAAGEGIDPESNLSRSLAHRTEEHLSPSMKHRRDVFIREYMRDFNGSQAWLRMKAECDPQDAHKTFSAASAAEAAYRLKNEPYVAQRIAELVDAMDAVNMVSQQRVLAMLLREAELQGIGAKHAARVAAQKVLVDVLGMSSQAKAAAARTESASGGAGGPRGGVMVVPEVAGTADEWEAAAAQAQARLKEEVRK